MTQHPLRPIRQPLYAVVPIERVRPRPATVELPPLPVERPKFPKYLSPLPDLIRIVAAETLVPENMILSPRRYKEAARARQIVCFVAYDYFGITYPRIGRYLRRDHSTVLYAHQKVKAQRDLFEPELSRVLAECQSQTEQQQPEPEESQQ